LEIGARVPRQHGTEVGVRISDSDRGRHPSRSSLDRNGGYTMIARCTYLCNLFLSVSMLQCFQEKASYGSSPSPVFLSNQGELQGTDDNAPAGLERLSKRIALHNMRETRWDITTRGIPLELVGDSLLIVGWLSGRFRAEGKHYADRVAGAINTLDGMCSFFDVRHPAAGADLIRHGYREWNTKADILTHQAREGLHILTECFFLTSTKQSFTPARLHDVGSTVACVRLGAGVEHGCK